MKKHEYYLLTLVAFMAISCYSQVSTSPSGQVNNITTDFSFALNDGNYNRPMLRSGWISGIGDYLYLKHGGSNTEEYTFGLRISDGYGLDYGRNDFNNSFFSVRTNGNVGIGTSNPNSKLEVHSEVLINNPVARGSAYLKLDRGTEGKDGAVICFGQNGNFVWNTGLLYNGGGLTPDFYISQNSAIRDGSGAVLHIPELTIKTNGNIGVGTMSPDAKLAVKGKIHAEEVKVDLSVPGPDYVFKEGYDLMSLKEVQNYIKEHGHLPNIPSAKEMEANGIKLGEMNMKLLEKIEELTLYIVELEKETRQIKFMDERLESQNTEIERLKTMIMNISK
ncbi:hypothetical protein [Flagellimonas sp.]|uniref:hypothetical protein n=1 Tax=Flagellimonas sp. TaxID=2058762 RepID=UPI003AB6F8D3